MLSLSRALFLFPLYAPRASGFHVQIKKREAPDAATMIRVNRHKKAEFHRSCILQGAAGKCHIGEPIFPCKIDVCVNLHFISQFN